MPGGLRTSLCFSFQEECLIVVRSCPVAQWLWYTRGLTPGVVSSLFQLAIPPGVSTRQPQSRRGGTLYYLYTQLISRTKKLGPGQGFRSLSASQKQATQRNVASASRVVCCSGAFRSTGQRGVAFWSWLRAAPQGPCGGLLGVRRTL